MDQDGHWRQPGQWRREDGHVALTAVCDQCLTNMANMPIALFPIRDQDELTWRQCLEAACDLTREQFNTEWVQMVKYAQYLFNL
jgi:hypothetical protein